MSYIVEQTESFAKWHRELRDLRAKVAIARRITRAEKGHLGDIKSVGDYVSEMRIDVGAGYCVNFTLRGGLFICCLLVVTNSHNRLIFNVQLNWLKRYKV